MNIVCQARVRHNSGWSTEMALCVVLNAFPDLALGSKTADALIYKP
jgi:hypothetical protein